MASIKSDNFYVLRITRVRELLFSPNRIFVCPVQGNSGTLESRLSPFAFCLRMSTYSTIRQIQFLSPTLL
jgi:hypothetical protein